MNLKESIPSLFINLQSIYRKNLKIKNLTFPQILILYILPDGGEKLSKISDKIGVDISTMSRSIKVLEEKNYVKRDYLEKDKRVMWITFQPKGKKVKVEIENKFDNINKIIENRLNKRELYKIEQDLHELNWIILGIIAKNFDV